MTKTSLATIFFSVITSVITLVAAELSNSSVYMRKWTRKELQHTINQSKEWLGSNIGRDQVAPPPWTPMQVSGQSVFCWGKEFRYNNTLLPCSILTQGIELLTDTPMVKVLSAGNWITFQNAEVAINKIHNGLVYIKSVSRTNNLLLELETGYEFDGMGKITMRLSALRPVMVENVVLEFPLSAGDTTHLHLTGSRRNININGKVSGGAAYPPMSDSGYVPKEGLKLDAFREIIWLGSTKVGFSWFADSLDGWPLKDESDIQVITPAKNGSRSLIIKLADKSFHVNHFQEWIFGIQSTPMRPRMENFRSRVGWRLAANNEPFATRWNWGDGYYYPFQDTHPELAKADIAEQKAKGGVIMPTSSVEYFGMYRFSRNAYGAVKEPGLAHREVLVWKEQWEQIRKVDIAPDEALKICNQARKCCSESEPGGNSIDTILAMPQHTAQGNNWDNKLWKPKTYPERFCYNSSFQDYYIWKLDQLVRDTGLSAIYLDQQLYACCNHDHGCGYIDYKGEWSGQGNVFAMREAAKRIYMVFTSANGSVPDIMWHCSQQMVIPAMSFCTIYFDGEKYCSPTHSRSIMFNEFYSNILTEEVMQVQHMGGQFGFAADFLPKITRANYGVAPTPATVRDLMGLMMLHDSHVDAIRQTYHPTLVTRIQNARLSFPLDQMKVCYYWDNNTGIASTPERVKHIMHYDEKHALLILFNWSDKPVVAAAILDFIQLGLKVTGLEVKDKLTGEKIRIDNGKTIYTELLPRDFRMLELNWHPVSDK